MSDDLYAQRPSVGSTFKRIISLLKIPNNGVIPGVGFIEIVGPPTEAVPTMWLYDDFGQLRFQLNSAQMKMGPDLNSDQELLEWCVTDPVFGLTNAAFLLRPPTSTGTGSAQGWFPAVMQIGYLANAGNDEQQQLVISGLYPTGGAASSRSFIKILSESPDTTKTSEVQLLSDTVVILNKSGSAVFATFRINNSGGSPKLRLESTQALAGNRMIDLLKSGDSNAGWSIDGDGKQQWGPGGGTALDTNLYRSAANILATDDSFALNAAGAGLKVKEGANATSGIATLVAGTVVVNTTKVTANSRIHLTSQADGGTPGFQRVTARTAATSFTITSSNAADTSTIAWFIVEPA